MNMEYDEHGRMPGVERIAPYPEHPVRDAVRVPKAHSDYAEHPKYGGRDSQDVDYSTHPDEGIRYPRCRDYVRHKQPRMDAEILRVQYVRGDYLICIPVVKAFGRFMEAKDSRAKNIVHWRDVEIVKVPK